MKIDPEQLAMTDFLNPKDDRFKQLDDGTWALSEWKDKKESKEAEEIIEIEGFPPEIPEDAGHQTLETEGDINSVSVIKTRLEMLKNKKIRTLPIRSQAAADAAGGGGEC